MILAAHFRTPLYELMERMSAREFIMWQDFFRLIPFGAYVDNWRIGRLICGVYESQGAKNIKPEQFMPGKAAEDNRFLGPKELAEKIAGQFGLDVRGRKLDDS